MAFKNVEEFKKVLQQKRNAGKVTCSIREAVPLDIDVFVQPFGFQGLGDKWRTVDKKEAREIARYVISIDLAYESELDSKPIASKLADYFIGLFSFEANYYTNAEFLKDGDRLALEGYVWYRDHCDGLEPHGYIMGGR
ncbi:MAG TPA: hypothetical protein VEY51_02840 [Chondromyces sp.]|nr:hypothetical protein [Chondromyces sp.]